MSTAAPGLPLPTACAIFASGSAGSVGFAAGFGAAALASGSGSDPQAASARPAIEPGMAKRFILIMLMPRELHGHAARLRAGGRLLEVVDLDDDSTGGKHELRDGLVTGRAVRRVSRRSTYAKLHEPAPP